MRQEKIKKLPFHLRSLTSQLKHINNVCHKRKEKVFRMLPNTDIILNLLYWNELAEQKLNNDNEPELGDHWRIMTKDNLPVLVLNKSRELCAYSQFYDPETKTWENSDQWFNLVKEEGETWQL